jgi:hypothetical protein
MEEDFRDAVSGVSDEYVRGGSYIANLQVPALIPRIA